MGGNENNDHAPVGDVDADMDADAAGPGSGSAAPLNQPTLSR